MIYSFIGLGRPIAAVNNILKTRLASYKREHPQKEPPLEAGGIFAADLSMAAAFAGENDMCAYMTIEELLGKSDIIFLFLNDRALKNISVTLGKYILKNKIFCHFSPAFSASILDFNSANTYASMLMPSFYKDDEGRTLADSIIAEGYGRQLCCLKDVFELLGIDLELTEADERLLYLTAVSLVKDMPLILKHTAKRLVKYSLASSPRLAAEILTLIEELPSELNSYDGIEALDADFVASQCRALKTLGLNDITRLFCSLAVVSADLLPMSEEADKIRKTVRRILDQK